MKKLLIIALALGSVFTAYSQETQEEVSRDLTVEREYDPTVANAKKISPTPQKEVVEVEQPEITYTTWSKVEKTEKTASMAYMRKKRLRLSTINPHILSIKPEPLLSLTSSSMMINLSEI